MNMLKKLGVLVVSIGILGGLFHLWDSTPEMAWSHSKNRCVGVTQQGKVIPGGCQLVAEGKMRAEKYFVK